MPNSQRWNLRVTNDCLFIDDVTLGRNILQQNARPGLRPYIHPLRISNSDGILCLTEDSPWHHPWQHGVQTGYHGVNGCDFWFDPGQHPTMDIGTIEPSAPRIISTDPPSWIVEAIWRHADGSLLLAEKQEWTLREADNDDLIFLDLEWTVQAIPDVEIEQHAYGGFFIRMPFRRNVGATVFNSEGQQEDDTEQQPAKWVELHMPLENSEAGAGIALLDHPQNPGHPVHWRVDGQRGINPAPCIPGPIHLASGESMRHRYRMALHPGKLDAKELNKLWDSYAS